MPLMARTIIELVEFMRDEGRITEQECVEFKRKCKRDQIVAPIVFGVVCIVFLCCAKFFN